MKKSQLNTLLLGIFYIGGSTVAMANSIIAFTKGSFDWGTSRNPVRSIVVQPETHPYFYWGWLIFWTGAAVWFGYLGVKDVLVALGRR